MRRLFTYIIRYNFIFFFLILEVLSFILIIQNNYQRASFFTASNNLTGSVLNVTSNISEYFSLRTTNVELARENQELRRQLNSSFSTTDTNSYVQKDSLFTYVYAKVIKNSVNKQKNYLMINKGRDHGIDRDMGVITSTGVVGTVVEVSDHYARIMSVLNIQNKINARIKINRHLGNIEWDGRDYRNGLLTDIPSHVSLGEGDTIITSGNSFIFPEGLVIGTVLEYSGQSSEKFNTALVRFSVDYNSLHHVFIITNLMKNEIEQLETEE